MLWSSGTASYRVRSLMLRARSTVPYALWAGVGLTILAEKFVRTVRTAQSRGCTYFDKKTTVPELRSALVVASKFQTVVQFAPEACINPLLFQQHQTLDIRLNSPGARTAISSTFPEDLNGWYCTPVSVVVQRWYRALRTVPPHLAASRRVPYQPQASPGWRCDSIATLPSRCQDVFFCGRRRTHRSAFVVRSRRRSRMSRLSCQPFWYKQSSHY